MVCSYADIVMENTNIAIRGRYSKYFIELFFLEHSCFLVFNMPLNMSEEERQPCILLEVESNVNHAGCNTGVIVGVYKPCSKCFKRTVRRKRKPLI
jgi:hypothetical protein